MNVFDELLSIKRFREDQAELAFRQQRQACHEAEQEAETARQQLKSFQQWAERHELELYNDLCSRAVRIREIEQVLEDVAFMRSNEEAHRQAVEEARQRHEHELEALASCRELHRDACRQTEKFIELARLHLHEQLQELEKKEDLEMEEAAMLARDRDEWEEHEEYEPA